MSRSLLSAIIGSVSLASIMISGQAAAKDMKPITIGYYPGAVGSALNWVAADKGFYEAEGLKPELLAVGSGTVMTSGIASGTYDVGVNGFANVAVARERGLDLAGLSATTKIIYTVLVGKDVPVPDAGKYPDMFRDLKGLKWGSYGRGTDSERFLRLFAQDAGLDVDKDITWIGVGGPGTGLPALEQKQIDVYTGLNPSDIFAVARGYAKIILNMREGQPEKMASLFKGGYNFSFTSRSTIEKKPDVIKGYNNAQVKAYCWLQDKKNFDDAVALLGKWMPNPGVPDDAYRNAIKSVIDTVAVTFSSQDVKNWSDFYVSAGVLKNPAKAEDILWSDATQAAPNCG